MILGPFHNIPKQRSTTYGMILPPPRAMYPLPKTAKGHRLKDPPIPLVITDVVGEEVDGADALLPVVFDDVGEEIAGQSLPPIVFFDVNGTDARRKVLAVVEVIFDDAHAANDIVPVHQEIPFLNIVPID